MTETHRVTIYVPPALHSRLWILPPRTISRICQAALLAAVEQAEREHEEAMAAGLDDAFAED
jgi:hypothetical protein